MAIIVGVATEDCRKYWPQMFGGLTTYGFKPILNFKVGIGGWVDPGGGKESRTPDALLRRLDNSLQDLDIIVDSTRIVKRYPAWTDPPDIPYFQKTLLSTDLTFTSPSTLEIACTLDFGDYNSDGSGNPEIWEIGIFSGHPEVVSPAELMVAYATFPQQTKDVTKQLLNVVKIVF